MGNVPETYVAHLLAGAGFRPPIVIITHKKTICVDIPVATVKLESTRIQIITAEGALLARQVSTALSVRRVALRLPLKQAMVWCCQDQQYEQI